MNEFPMEINFSFKKNKSFKIFLQISVRILRHESAAPEFGKWTWFLKNTYYELCRKQLKQNIGRLFFLTCAKKSRR